MLYLTVLGGSELRECNNYTSIQDKFYVWRLLRWIHFSFSSESCLLHNLENVCVKTHDTYVTTSLRHLKESTSTVGSLVSHIHDVFLIYVVTLPFVIFSGEIFPP